MLGRELNGREHDALELLAYNESVDLVYVAVVAAVFCMGLLVTTTIFH
jgi:hypothetical protein